MGILSKCPHCGKRMGTFSLDKKVRCTYCLSEGCTNCFFFVKSESDLYKSQNNPVNLLVKGFLMSENPEEEIYCCHESHCFQSFIEILSPFARSQEILEKIVNEPHLQKIYINSSIQKLMNLFEDKKFNDLTIWACFSFLDYSLRNNLFLHDIQKNRDFFKESIEYHLKNDFLGACKIIENDEGRFNKIFGFFTDVISLQLLRLYINLRKENYDLCIENLKDISDPHIREPLVAIFNELRSGDIDIAQSALDSLETYEGVNTEISKTFSALVNQKMVKARIFRGRNPKSSSCFLDRLIDLALKSYDFYSKSLDAHSHFVSWYILAKTGILTHLDVSYVPSFFFPMYRSIRIPKGLYGIGSRFGALYFYVDSMKSSNRWNQTCIAFVKQELNALLGELSLGDYQDLDYPFWKEIWKYPFGEEIVFAYKSIGEGEIFGKTMNIMRICISLGSLHKDNLATLLTIYFDRSREDAIYYLKYDIFPPEELRRMREFVKGPEKLSKFAEKIDSTFAKKGEENWHGEEARDYRILNAMYFLFPELVRGIHIDSKMMLIERLNERLARILSSEDIERNWELLYILRIFEIIGENIYVDSPQKYIEIARKKEESTRARVFTEPDEMLWSYDMSLVVNSVSINSERHVAASSQGILQLSDESCMLLWKHEIKGIISSVSINQMGYIAAGSYDNHIYLFDRSGNLLWRFDMGCLVNTVSMNDEGFVAAGSEDNQVALLDNSGTLLWRCETDLWVISVSINREGSVAVGSDSVYLFDRLGRQAWRFDAGYIISSVSINQEGSVAVGCKNVLLLLDMNGNLCWSFEAESEIEAVSINDDGYVVAGSYDSVYLVDGSGDLMWRHNTDGAVGSVSINQEGYIAVGHKETLSLFKNSWKNAKKSRREITEEEKLLISRYEEEGYNVERFKKLIENPKAFKDEVEKIREMIEKRKELKETLKRIDDDLKSLSRQLAEEKITGDQFDKAEAHLVEEYREIDEKIRKIEEYLYARDA